MPSVVQANVVVVVLALVAGLLAWAPGWGVPRRWRVAVVAVVAATFGASALVVVRLADAVLAWPAASSPALDRWLSSRAVGISNMLVVGMAAVVTLVMLWAIAWLRPPAAQAVQPAAQPQPQPQQQGGHWGAPAGQTVAASQVQAFGEDLRW